MEKFTVRLYGTETYKKELILPATSPIDAYNKMVALAGLGEDKVIVIVTNKQAIWIYDDKGTVEYYVRKDIVNS